VLVTPLLLEPATPAALLAVMAVEPHRTRKEVAELTQAIAEG
jgi:hypothetical protein